MWFYSAGTYGVTVIDRLASSATDSIVVGYFNSPIVDLGPDQDICLVDSICFVVPPGAGISYMWNDTIPGSTFCTSTVGTY
ncbi:MAG: hypothetical protein HRT57_17520 [Crocinitomicaceae bacterium]|nr:hypothetical protein [Crocinitomicaceae bacterium]